MTTIKEIEEYRRRQQEVFAARAKAKAEKRAKKLRQMYEIAKMHLDEGLSYAEIGKRKGLSRQRIFQLLKEFSELPDFIEHKETP